METLGFIQRFMQRFMQRQGTRTIGKASINTRDEVQASYPNIPEKIILQILPRLPLNSLSRFKCVSQKWLSMISEISVTKRGREMVLVLSNNLLHTIDLEKSLGERVYKSKESSYKYRAIYGSCNGLLLVLIDDDFFLWNPLTIHFKKVLAYANLCDKRNVASGLCYDSSTDEYKVVMVLVDNNYNTPGYGTESVVVGSFKNKSWTHVDCSSYIITSFDSGPTVNEHLHWRVSKKKKSQYSRIVYFNPQMGTFEKVPMPQPKQSEGDVIYGLGVLDGCLCMSRSKDPSNGECNFVEVLVMKEYGVANSWTLMFIVQDLRPFGYTKNGEALALKTPTHDRRKGIWHISVYNPMDDSTRDIPIPTPLLTHYGHVNPVTYEESLIKPNDYNWEDTYEESLIKPNDYNWEDTYEESLIKPNDYNWEDTYEKSLIKPNDYNWEDEELREEATYVEYFLDGSHQKMHMEICIHWHPHTKKGRLLTFWHPRREGSEQHGRKKRDFLSSFVEYANK